MHRTPLADMAEVHHPAGMSFQSPTHDRLQVWTALSELFLDTELQEHDLSRIAAVLARSAYTPGELEDILKNEVSPAFSANLLSVAGEWQPWSEDQVRDIMERSIRLHLSTHLLDRMRAALSRRMIPAEWHGIVDRLKDSKYQRPEGSASCEVLYATGCSRPRADVTTSRMGSQGYFSKHPPEPLSIPRSFRRSERTWMRGFPGSETASLSAGRRP